MQKSKCFILHSYFSLLTSVPLCLCGEAVLGAWNDIHAFPSSTLGSNFLRPAPCGVAGLSLSIRNESRPASLVMAVTDF